MSRTLLADLSFFSASRAQLFLSQLLKSFHTTPSSPELWGFAFTYSSPLTYRFVTDFTFSKVITCRVLVLHQINCGFLGSTVSSTFTLPLFGVPVSVLVSSAVFVPYPSAGFKPAASSFTSATHSLWLPCGESFTAIRDLRKRGFKRGLQLLSFTQ